MNSILRPHQISFLNDIRTELRNGCRRLIGMAPTGFGKTLVGATMARGVLDRGRRAIFTCPRSR
jgi:superfamily II DNA or RNA helicase